MGSEMCIRDRSISIPRNLVLVDIFSSIFLKNASNILSENKEVFYILLKFIVFFKAIVVAIANNYVV